LLLTDPAGIKTLSLDMRGFFREVLATSSALILRFESGELIVLSILPVMVFSFVCSEWFVVFLALAFVTERANLSEVVRPVGLRVLGAMVGEVDFIGV